MEARSREAVFMLFQPNSVPARLVLPASHITLGRATDCTIPIKDRFLSRKHAEIIFDSGAWVLRDCGSANGTFLNGVRVERDLPLKPGDRIALGDSEIVFRPDAAEPDTSGEAKFSILDSNPSTNFSIPLHDSSENELQLSRHPERMQILNALALELIEDRPLSELFDFMLERIMNLMQPSRAAFALLGADRKTFEAIRMRKRDENDPNELTISRTLLAQVVEEKKALSFVDVRANELLQQAKSIVGQSIRSALCAPLLIGDNVLGVLYMDYIMTQSRIAEEDVRLTAQVARFAAVKLETTRLREEAQQKAKLDQELQTAYVVQSRLLPAAPPEVDGYMFEGRNRPARTVSGDYYDFVRRDDGRIVFVIADVSGKGITAALVMAGLATAFSIFTRENVTPAALVRQLNVTLTPRLAPTKFVTLFAGILDPATGEVAFANAGHVPPLVVTSSGVQSLKTTDMVVGLFAAAPYREQSVTLAPGDSLLLFTDGITEVENPAGEEMGYDAVREFVGGLHGRHAKEAADQLEQRVMEFACGAPPGDDVTILALSRHA